MATTNVFFISIPNIKDNCLIDTNVSDKTLKISLRTCEETYTQELLGRSLYIALKTGVTNNTLTNYQRTLLEDYLIPYEYATIEVLAFYDMLLKISQAGINVTTPDHTQQKTKDELLTLRKHKERNANFYAGLTKDYIIENLQYFPEYSYIAKGLVPRKFGNSGFFLDEADFSKDDEYNRRRAENRYEESL